MPALSTRAGRMTYSWNGIAPDAEATPALVLIHGAGGQARDWPAEWRYRSNAAQTLGVRTLPETHALSGRAVYALDLPGHGGSDPLPDGAPTVGRLAETVLEAADALGLEQPVLAGHSMGGGIALTAAVQAPEKVGGLVIIGSSARLPVTDQILDGLTSDFDATVDMIVKFSWAKMAPAVYRETGRRHMKACGPDQVLADFTACAAYDAREGLSAITVPVLVLAGERDKMVPQAASEKLVAGLGDATLDVVAGAGHFMHFEQPGRVARSIETFMAQKF
ncbi:MAG: alpha/beta hydrolase [Pseudomonadota bacterium]